MSCMCRLGGMTAESGVMLFDQLVLVGACGLGRCERSLDVERLGLADEIVQVGFAQCAGLLVDHMALLHDHERGDGLHVGCVGEFLVLVDVDLAEEDVGVLVRHLVEDRAERLARAAPGCEEIEQRDLVALHCLFEICGSEFLNCHI